MDPKSSRQLPATSPSARAVGGSTPGMPCGTATATGPPSRAASAELARTAPLAGARWLWCGDAGTSAGSTGLHNIRKRRSARLSLVLCSGELGERSAVCRCRLPSVGCLRPPAVRPRSSGVGSARPRQHTGWEAGNRSNGFLQTLHKEERTGKSLQRPVAGVAALPVCWRLRSRGGRNNRCPPAAQVDPTALATPEENSENGAYVYHVVPEAFRRELAKGFHAAIVAKALREHGHLNGELGRLAYLERLPGLGHQRVYRIRSSIFAEYWWVQRVSRVQPR